MSDTDYVPFLEKADEDAYNDSIGIRDTDNILDMDDLFPLSLAPDKRCLTYCGPVCNCSASQEARDGYDTAVASMNTPEWIAHIKNVRESMVWECDDETCTDEGFYRDDIGEYLCDTHYNALPLMDDVFPLINKKCPVYRGVTCDCSDRCNNIQSAIWECDNENCTDEGFYRSDIGEYLCDMHYNAMPITEDMKPKE